MLRQDKIDEYFTLATARFYREKDPEKLVARIAKDKVHIRIINTKESQLLTILRGSKVIAQDNLLYFIIPDTNENTPS